MIHSMDIDENNDDFDEDVYNIKNKILKNELIKIFLLKLWRML